MFFVVSKTLGVLAIPSHAVVALAIVGAGLLRTRFVRAGRTLLTVSLVLLLLFAFTPAGTALLLLLEERFPPWRDVASRPPDGIVILGGAIEPEGSLARGTVMLNAAADRVLALGALARRYPSARIIYSGGNANLLLHGPPEAAFVGSVLESLGVPRDRVQIEERSRNTVENAHFSKAIADPRPGERWLLVTSALHMPRAIGAFRKAGFPVEAYPVDWQTSGWSDLWTRLRWPVDALRHTDSAAKEWLGLFAYWITGHSSELLPRPQIGVSEAAAGQGDRRP